MEILCHQLLSLFINPYLVFDLAHSHFRLAPDRFAVMPIPPDNGQRRLEPFQKIPDHILIVNRMPLPDNSLPRDIPARHYSARGRLGRSPGWPQYQ